MSPLSLTELSRREELEHIIQLGLGTFYYVGSALLEIRDSRLYRSTHVTFEDYCRDRWKMARNYANKLILAAVVVANLGTTVPIPTNEAQVRPLTDLEPEQQRKVWLQAVNNAPMGKVTALNVEAAKAHMIATGKLVKRESGSLRKLQSSIRAHLARIEKASAEVCRRETSQYWAPEPIFDSAVQLGKKICLGRNEMHFVGATSQSPRDWSL